MRVRQRPSEFGLPPSRAGARRARGRLPAAPASTLSTVETTPRANERRQRRELRRRRVRRRRLVALCVLAAVAAGALSLALRGEGTPASARGASAEDPGGSPAATTDSLGTGQTGSDTAEPSRGRLGSGNPVTLAFGGDVHFESPIREQLLAAPAGVLAGVSDVLEAADVAMVNLETAVTDRGEPAPKDYVFRAPASAFEALREGGVDVVTLANNHGLDFGLTGMRDTLAAARRAGVQVVGAGRNAARAYAPYRITVDGQRIAIIGATQVLDDHLIEEWTAGPGKPGLASAKEVGRLVRAVREARETSDTVVVYVHWGVELMTCPTGDQQSLAERLVQAGADVVVGAHAHVLQGAGRLGKAFVAYGLGNFVFYAFREETSRTGVLEVTVTGRRIDGYRWIPGRISNGLPSLLSGAERAQARRSWLDLRDCTGLRR